MICWYVWVTPVSYTHLDVYKRQAIIKAALAVRSRRPAWKITPEIMVPLVGEAKELAYVKDIIDRTEMCIRDSPPSVRGCLCTR